MRLPPHVPSQAPLRPARSALRFSPARLRQIQSCSAFALLAVIRSEEPPMPFARRGVAALTARLDVRVAPDEKTRLRAIADAAGIAVAELVRLRAVGRPVVSRTDATTIRELRRIGGLLKKVHADSGGAYSRETAAVLDTLHGAIRRLASGDGRSP
jgi:hypothetical protein